MAFLTLAEAHLRWLTDAMRDDRRRRHPHLFTIQPGQLLTLAQMNNEVNSYVGWAMNDAAKKYDKHDEALMARLLRSMLIREQQLDDDYLSTCYDPNMAIFNHGGLTLVRKEYFEWAKNLMTAVRNNYTEDSINQDPRGSFQAGKDAIFGKEKLQDDFVLLCLKHSETKVDKTVLSTVYKEFVSKAIHSRFGTVFSEWKEKYVSKHGEVAFRTKLKAGGGTSKKKESSSKKGRSNTKVSKNVTPETTNPSASAAFDNPQLDKDIAGASNELCMGNIQTGPA